MPESEAASICERWIAEARARSLAPAAAEELAKAALKARREREALPAVHATALNSRNPSIWQWVGLLHRALDEHDAAGRAYRTAVLLAPASAPAAHGLALVALEAGEPALALYQRALELAPNDAVIVRGRAAARVAEGQIELAIAELDRVLETSPGWREGHEATAELRCLANQRERLTLSIERQLLRYPADPALWQTLLGILVKAGMYEAADAAFRRATDALADSSPLEGFAALIAAEIEDVARADLLFKTVAARGDDYAIYHIRHLLRTGRLDEAARRAEAMLAGPRASEAWPYVGSIWRSTGNPRADWLEADSRLVRSYDLRLELPPLDILSGVLRKFHMARGRYLAQSVRGGTQTDGPLFCRQAPEIRQLRSAALKAVSTYVDQLPPLDARHPVLGARRDRPIRFAGSWSVRLLEGGCHVSHSHPRAWLSSAMHIVVPSESAERDGGILAFGEPPEELGLNLPPLRVVAPKPGHVVIFPATMWHRTLPFKGGERLTVAFDVAAPV